ncbi:MAG: phage tail sheath family protein [Paraburkholderia sp.]|uniref:phage tail sheath subtilisin-like domain-containing protein n=1 Tax=Paraburkholderia sp. TaxID=1926495 RepID=UPI0011F64E04|nr:phage tail sheath subtilisin-like domain-containing protein [Paraburkholderia sp.]TAM05618.1 MAG: phage tail sheath family protein [Paraburkholderia sp.]
MPANYLHGVETIERETGARPVKIVKSAVIALIGTASEGPVNEPTLCLSEKDAAQFGPHIPGFTIPQALKSIYDFGAGTVIVVNVLNPKRHINSASDVSVKFDPATNRARLGYPAVLRYSLKYNGKDANLVLGKDFIFDWASGDLVRLPGSEISPYTQYSASVTYINPAMITAADIIGGVDEAGRRLGMKALKDTFNLFGFSPKIVISPAFGTLKSVATELEAMASELGAMAYVDAPVGRKVSDVLHDRGMNGSWNSSSDRVRLCYPHVKVYDPATNSEQLEPLSPRAAGLRAKVDLDKGYWWSSSNQPLVGVTGVERPLTAMIDDPQSEVNLLNEAGITTVFSSYGSGYRLWGNRTAAFPTVTHMRNFENVRRTGDVINESLRYFSLQYIDMPIDNALIDSLLESVNGFGRKLIGDGALLGFKAWYDPSRNPEQELAAGHLLINYKYTVPPPMERLTFETEITSEYLLTLKGGK